MITDRGGRDYIVLDDLQRPLKLVSIYLSMAALALRRPRAIPAILGASWAFRSRTWYRSFPFLPIPPRSYLRWRMETAFGDPEAVPSLDDLERYLNWTASMRSRMTRRAPGGEALHD